MLRETTQKIVGKTLTDAQIKTIFSVDWIFSATQKAVGGSREKYKQSNKKQNRINNQFINPWTEVSGCRREGGDVHEPHQYHNFVNYSLPQSQIM